MICRSQEPVMAFIDECKLYRLPGIVAPVARRVRQMVKERSQGGDGGYWSSGLRFVLGGPGYGLWRSDATLLGATLKIDNEHDNENDWTSSITHSPFGG